MSNILTDFSEGMSEKMLYENLSKSDLKKEIYLKLLALNALKKVLDNTQVEFAYQNSLFFLPEIFEETGIFDFYIRNNVFDVIILAPNSDESIIKHERNDANSNVSYYLVAELMPDIQSVKLLGYFDAGLYEETYVDNHVVKEKLNIISSLSKMLEAAEIIDFDDISEQFFDLTAKYMDKTLYKHELKEFFDILYNSEKARDIYNDLSRFEFISRCSINQEFYDSSQSEPEDDIVNFDEIEQYSDIDLTDDYKIPEETENTAEYDTTPSDLPKLSLEFEDILDTQEKDIKEIDNDEFLISEYINPDLNDSENIDNYEMYEPETENSSEYNTSQTSIETLDVYQDLPNGDVNPTDGMETFMPETDSENQIEETVENSKQPLNQMHTPTLEEIDNMNKSESPKEIGMLFSEDEIENLENSQEGVKHKTMPGMQLMIDSTKKPKVLPLVVIIVFIILGIGLLFLAMKPKNTSLEDDFTLSEDSAVTDSQLIEAPKNEEVEEEIQEIPAQDNTPQIHSSVSRDIKSGAAPVILKNIAWEIPESISQDSAFTRYLQIAGKNIKTNLEKDLLNTTEFAYNHTVKVSMTVKRNSPVKNIKIVSTSGSKEVDEIVIQSIKETLKYINSPVMDNDKGNKDVTLVINI